MLLFVTDFFNVSPVAVKIYYAAVVNYVQYNSIWMLYEIISVCIKKCFIISCYQ